LGVQKEDLILGSIINDYRNSLDLIEPYSWLDDVNLKDNKVIIKSSHFYDLRNRTNFFVSKPDVGTDSGCNGTCAGLCEGCGGTCSSTCISCTGSCSGSCRGTCAGGCDGCDGRWF